MRIELVKPITGRIIFGCEELDYSRYMLNPLKSRGHCYDNYFIGIFY